MQYVPLILTVKKSKWQARLHTNLTYYPLVFTFLYSQAQDCFQYVNSHTFLLIITMVMWILVTLIHEWIACLQEM